MPACQGIVTLLKAMGFYQLNQRKRFFIACNQETNLSESERMITVPPVTDFQCKPLNTRRPPTQL